MPTTPVPPRALTDSEHAVLALLLAGEFPGAAELRAQLPHAQVVAVWVVGLPSVDLEVPDTVPAAPLPDGEAVGAEVRDEAGEYVGGIGVWLTGGRLSAIEYYWVTDESPRRLPDPERLTVVP